MFLASQGISGPGGRWRKASCAPSCAPAWRAYGSLAQEVGGARLAVENITDPPTQAVENITPWQKAPDMLCSQALADTQMASPAKCKLAVKSKKSRRAKKRSCWGSVCYGVIVFFYEYQPAEAG